MVARAHTPTRVSDMATHTGTYTRCVHTTLYCEGLAIMGLGQYGSRCGCICALMLYATRLGLVIWARPLWTRVWHARAYTHCYCSGSLYGVIHLSVRAPAHTCYTLRASYYGRGHHTRCISYARTNHRGNAFVYSPRVVIYTRGK